MGVVLARYQFVLLAKEAGFAKPMGRKMFGEAIAKKIVSVGPKGELEILAPKKMAEMLK